MADGRFAPSPTGDLHLGNLRTALVAWLFARSSGSRFLVRMEDLDRHQSSAEHEQTQLEDLAALGIDWDGEVVRQSDRFELYDAAIASLTEAGLTYPCYCTRREIREAVLAPHGEPTPEGAYPGTCRRLTAAERSGREAEGRPPATRLRVGTDGGPPVMVEVIDDLAGPLRAVVDDVVLRRNDGIAAYNLAVVVDDADQGVGQVVRGDDLLPSSPRQRLLSEILGLPPLRYAHVPLALNSEGKRLAKRDGAVTLADRRALGEDASVVRSMLAISLGLVEVGETVGVEELLARFDPARLPAEPWIVDLP